MAKVYPKDTYQKKNERRSFKILFSLIDPDSWEYLGHDNNDHGVDHSFELIEDEKYKGYRILSQVKSRTIPSISGDCILFDFPVKTANYAVGCSQPFIFFFVDLTKKEAFYLSLQDFFIENKNKMLSLEKNTSTIRVKIPINNKVGNDNLKKVAKSQYSYDEERGLVKTR